MNQRFVVLIIVSGVFCSVILGGCAGTAPKEVEMSSIDMIDQEETYPEAPGQLEVTYTSISEITSDATDIVKVSVVETVVELLEGFPQTHTYVQVSEVYKGELEANDKIEVIEEGGHENKVMGGIPQMSVASQYILFLREYNEKYYICGAFQGRFIIRDGYVFQQATEDVKLQSYSPAQFGVFSSSVRNDLSSYVSGDGSH